jgi:hypothetical protein
MQVCQTLEKLPDERYIFMKLTYTEDTPSDYEPTGFRAYDNADADHFSQRPFMMCSAPLPDLHAWLTCMHASPLHSTCIQGALCCMHAPAMHAPAMVHEGCAVVHAHALDASLQVRLTRTFCVMARRMGGMQTNHHGVSLTVKRCMQHPLCGHAQHALSLC